MRSRGRVDTRNPVEWRHRLNAGLVAWYLALPSRAGGVPSLAGLCPPASPVNQPTWGGMPNGFPWLSLTAASDQYADCGNPAALQITGALTVVVRYRLRTAPADTTAYQLVAKDADTGGRAYTLDTYYQWTNVPGSGIRFYVNGGGASNNMVTEGRLPVTGEERWVCGTFTPSTSGGLKVYVDGVLAASNVGTTDASIPSAATNVLIGRRGYAGYTDPLNGWIGDVRVYNRAMSAADVASLYWQHQMGYPDLLRWYTPRAWLIPAVSPPPPPPAGGFPAAVVGGGYGW